MDAEAATTAAWRKAGNQVLCQVTAGAAGSGRAAARARALTRKEALNSLGFLVDTPKGCAMRLLMQVRHAAPLQGCPHHLSPLPHC